MRRLPVQPLDLLDKSDRFFFGLHRLRVTDKSRLLNDDFVVGFLPDRSVPG
jgi:hypothetical protein